MIDAMGINQYVIFFFVASQNIRLLFVINIIGFEIDGIFHGKRMSQWQRERMQEMR